MRKCIVGGCNSNHIKPYVPTFLFPKDVERRNQWEKNIGQPNLKITSSIGVCIKHFPDDSVVRYDSYDTGTGIVKTIRKKVKLKVNAAPTLYLSTDCPPPPSLNESFNEEDVIDNMEDSVAKGVHQRRQRQRKTAGLSHKRSSTYDRDYEPAMLRNLLQKPIPSKRPVITLLKAEEVLHSSTEDEDIEVLTLHSIPTTPERKVSRYGEMTVSQSNNPPFRQREDSDRKALSYIDRRLSVGSSSSNGSLDTGKSLSLISKRRKPERPPPTVTGRKNDCYCWVCHKEGIVLCCVGCPRAYHLRCAGEAENCDKWVCTECRKVLSSECGENKSRMFSLLTMDQFCMLLKCSISRIKTRCANAFHHPVPAYYSSYLDYVIHPMDLSLIEKNTKQNAYGSTDSFLADIKWILHNSIVFNGASHPLSQSARSIVKSAENDMAEIDVCPDCFLHNYNRNKDWFSEVCRFPHPVVWAKLKGFPYWPAKVVRILNDNVDARFFGAHDRAWVPVCQCYHLSKEMPTTSRPKKKGTYDTALEELQIHVHLLKKKFGVFVYAPYRTTFDPTNKIYMYHGIDIDNLTKGEDEEGEIESDCFALASIENNDSKFAIASQPSSSSIDTARTSIAKGECEDMEMDIDESPVKKLCAIKVDVSSLTKPFPDGVKTEAENCLSEVKEEFSEADNIVKMQFSPKTEDVCAEPKPSLFSEAITHPDLQSLDKLKYSLDLITEMVTSKTEEGSEDLSSIEEKAAKETTLKPLDDQPKKEEEKLDSNSTEKLEETKSEKEAIAEEDSSDTKSSAPIAVTKKDDIFSRKLEEVIKSCKAKLGLDNVGADESSSEASDDDEEEEEEEDEDQDDEEEEDDQEDDHSDKENSSSESSDSEATSSEGEEEQEAEESDTEEIKINGELDLEELESPLKTNVETSPGPQDSSKELMENEASITQEIKSCAEVQMNAKSPESSDIVNTESKDNEPSLDNPQEPSEDLIVNKSNEEEPMDIGEKSENTDDNAFESNVVSEHLNKNNNLVDNDILIDSHNKNCEKGNSDVANKIIDELLTDTYKKFIDNAKSSHDFIVGSNNGEMPTDSSSKMEPMGGTNTKPLKENNVVIDVIDISSDSEEETKSTAIKEQVPKSVAEATPDPASDICKDITSDSLPIMINPLQNKINEQDKATSSLNCIDPKSSQHIAKSRTPPFHSDDDGPIVSKKQKLMMELDEDMDVPLLKLGTNIRIQKTDGEVDGLFPTFNKPEEDVKSSFADAKEVAEEEDDIVVLNPELSPPIKNMASNISPEVQPQASPSKLDVDSVAKGIGSDTSPLKEEHLQNMTKEELVKRNSKLERENKVLKQLFRTLKQKFERRDWQQRQNLLASRRTSSVMMIEMRKLMELEKKVIVERLQKKFEEKLETSINETKEKQWCSNCKQPSIYYCCWNTTYCSYNCQKHHWPAHRFNCTQVKAVSTALKQEVRKAIKMPNIEKVSDASSERKLILLMKPPEISHHSPLKVPTSAENSMTTLSPPISKLIPLQKANSLSQPNVASTQPVKYVITAPIKSAVEKSFSPSTTVQDSAEIITKVRSRQTDYSTAINQINQMTKETEETLKRMQFEEINGDELLVTLPSLEASTSQVTEMSLTPEDDEVTIIKNSDEDLSGSKVILGKNVEIDENILNRCTNVSTTATKLVRCLMSALFTEMEMAKSSVFGRKSNITKVTRPALTMDAVEAILNYVTKIFPAAPRTELVLAMNLKCKEVRKKLCFENAFPKFQADQVSEGEANKCTSEASVITPNAIKNPVLASNYASKAGFVFQRLPQPINSTMNKDMVPMKLVTKNGQSIPINGPKHLIGRIGYAQKAPVAIRPKPTIITAERCPKSLALTTSTFSQPTLVNNKPIITVIPTTLSQAMSKSDTGSSLESAAFLKTKQIGYEVQASNSHQPSVDSKPQEMEI